MTLPYSSVLSNEDLDDFASEFLGLKGTDSDMFYESYYNLNLDDEWDEEEYRDEIKQNWTY